jgi:tetratricopeptide (TPR) repeat protein
LSLDAAEAVANPAGLLDLFGSLERLVEHSLLRQEEGLEGEPRFVMLETIREFGLELLESAQEANAVRSQHMAYYLALAETAEPLLRTRGQLAWLDRLETEHDNLRLALDWALVHDPRAAVTLAADLAWFWHYRGYISEGRSWLERALALEPTTSSPKRTLALLGASALAGIQADMNRTQELATEALTAAQRDGDRSSQAFARMHLGIVAGHHGTDQDAQTILENAQLLAAQAGDRWTEALCYMNLSGTPWNQGDYQCATSLLEAGLAAAKDSGDEWLITVAGSMLGLLAIDQEDYGRAIALLEQSLARQRVIQDRIGDASSLLWLGMARRYHGDVDQAEEHLHDALASAHRLGDPFHTAASLVALGEVAIARGDALRAIEYCRDALRTATSAQFDPSWQLIGLGAAFVAASEAEAGVRLLAAEARTREQSQGALSPGMQRDVDAAMRLARSCLGQDGFDAAWAKGQTMSMEDIIADALSTAEGLIHSGT